MLKENVQTNFRQELYNLYEMATNYMTNNTDKPFAVLDKAAEIYVNYKNQLSPSLQKVTGKCLCFINHDFESEMTFSEYASYGDELIEDLSGFLGEYFSD